MKAKQLQHGTNDVRPRRISRVRKGMAAVLAGAALFVSTLFPIKSLNAEEKPTEKPRLTLTPSSGIGYNSRTKEGRGILGIGISTEVFRIIYFNGGIGLAVPVSEDSKPTNPVEHVSETLGVRVLEWLTTEIYAYSNQNHLGVKSAVGGDVLVKVSSRVTVIAGSEVDDWTVVPVFVGADVDLGNGFNAGALGIWATNIDGLGGRVKLSKAFAERWSVYADLFAIGTPETRKLLFEDFVAGLACSF